MTNYQPRFKRREAGGYTATFGVRSKKLRAILEHGSQGWAVKSGDAPGHLCHARVPKIATLKKDWGEWARIEWKDAGGRAYLYPYHSSR